MRRREFVTLVGGAVAWPMVARTQPAMPVIGFLGTESPRLFTDRLRVFRQGLGELGFVEGRNVSIEYRWAESQYDRLAGLAADLVGRQPDVIHTTAASGAALAAKSNTTTIPVVFVMGADPVQLGLVESLSRPGGNLTGVATLNVDLGAKRLEIMREMLPAATRVGLIVNPRGAAAQLQIVAFQDAARALGLSLQIFRVSSVQDFDVAFTEASKQSANFLVIGADPLFTSRVEQLATLALGHGLPTVYHSRDFAMTGGLISYGGNTLDAQRLAGTYVGRILKGERAAELPVQQLTKVEMVLNLKTAKSFGIAVPLSLLGRADAVIE
jgi:putative tryptophan/tyrosine transport system substrate-binding protein